MPRGRPPKPTVLHQLHGTYRRDRHGDPLPLPEAKRAELTEAEARERAAELQRMRAAVGLGERRDR